MESGDQWCYENYTRHKNVQKGDDLVGWLRKIKENIKINEWV